jgi:hypothetical protein
MTDVDLLRRIQILRRHLIGLARALDEIETEIIVQPNNAIMQAPGAVAAAASATREYRIGPQEVKVSE